MNYKIVIIGSDHNFDYFKLDRHKNTEDLLNTFISSRLIPTITKPTRITHCSATLIDNIYVSSKTFTKIQSSILYYDISDHMPVLVCTGTAKSKMRENKLVEFRRRQLLKLILLLLLKK